MSASLTEPENEGPVLHCPGCRSRLKVGREISFFEEKCPVCHREVSVTVFPRLFREWAVAEAGAPAAEGEASCSFFPGERAEKVCDECGCFLSARAAVSWAARDLCLPCLHRLREVEKDPGYIGRTRLQDKRALALVTWLAPLSLFTAPLALYLLLRYRGRPEGFAPRSRLTWWVAFTLAITWLIVWLVLIVVWVSLVLDGFS
jgi:hypothetical protein